MTLNNILWTKFCLTAAVPSGGAQIAAGDAIILGEMGAPLRCNFSSKFSDHLCVSYEMDFNTYSESQTENSSINSQFMTQLTPETIGLPWLPV